MSQAFNQISQNTAAAPRYRYWLGLPVIAALNGNFAEIASRLPQFGRQPFTMSSVNGNEVGVNPYLDMIYRLPARQGEAPVPVGVVSKNYRLVDHQHVLRTVSEVLADIDIDSSKMTLRGEWTVNGERARFSLIFPPDDRFTVNFGDQDEMRFRIEIFNSVDGSCKLMAVAGWLRFVCYNGLILGKAVLHIRQQHRQQLQIEELGRLFRDALQTAQEDQGTIATWRSRQIEPGVLAEWVDKDIFNKWGLKGAARVLAISRHGWDVKLKGDLRNHLPSEVATEKTIPVPGAERPVDTVFGASQVLTWVAGQRAELQDDLEWRTQVPDLMQLLLRRSQPRALRFGRSA